MDRGTDALIDTGALLAGVMNIVAALYLLDLDEFYFAGVTIRLLGCIDAVSRLVTPLKKATILEKVTFVVFDDARSRGSDMKLSPSAVAMLTLGPKLTKDKFMQGAGRMRQLGSHQKLWLASLEEVAQSILQHCSKGDVNAIKIVDVLNWVMNNTKSEALHGLLEWAISGLHFAESKEYPEAELLEEDRSLDSLYASAHHPGLISNIILSKASGLHEYCDADVNALVDVISERGCVYGLDEEVLVTAHNEECEREQHNEHYEERHGEVERARFQPVEEAVWDSGLVLRIGSVRELISTGAVQVQALKDFVRASIAPLALSQIRWSDAKFYGAHNFFRLWTCHRMGK